MWWPMQNGVGFPPSVLALLTVQEEMWRKKVRGMSGTSSLSLSSEARNDDCDMNSHSPSAALLFCFLVLPAAEDMWETAVQYRVPGLYRCGALPHCNIVIQLYVLVKSHIVPIFQVHVFLYEYYLITYRYLIFKWTLNRLHVYRFALLFTHIHIEAEAALQRAPAQETIIQKFIFYSHLKLIGRKHLHQ